MQSNETTINNLDLNFETTKFLVIGGNGFFGQHLVKGLLEKGASPIRVLDCAQKNLLSFSSSEVDFREGSICELGDVERAVRDCEVIFHTASSFGVTPFGSFGEGEVEWNVNVEGTRNVIRAARKEAKRTGKMIRLVYIGSTSAIFGGNRDFIEETEEVGYPLHHIDHYGRTKMVAEKEVLGANSEGSGLLTCVLRPNGIYGENENSHFLRVRKLAASMGDTILFDLGSSMDWTYVDNLSHACFLAASHLVPGSSVCGNDFNITDGEAWPLTEFFRESWELTGVYVRPMVTIPLFLVYFFSFLIELVCYLVGVRAPCTRIESLKSCRCHSFSIEKAKKHLGYTPIVSTSQGLKLASLDFARRYNSGL